MPLSPHQCFHMKQQHLKMYLTPYTIQQFHTSVIQYIDQTLKERSMATYYSIQREYFDEFLKREYRNLVLQCTENTNSAAHRKY